MLSRTRWIAAILLVLGLAIYFRTPGHAFLMWDDLGNLYGNPHLTRPFGDAFKFFWSQAYFGLYIPMTYTLWLLLAKAQAPELKPGLFHAVNILFHLANAGLVFLITRRVLKKLLPETPLERLDWGSAAGAALFLVHPVQVESVAWASGLRDLGSFFFGAVALLGFLISRESAQAPSAKKRRSKFQPPEATLPFTSLQLYLGATVAFTAALLAKPTAVIVPVLAFCLRRELRWLLPWFAMALGMTLLTKALQPDTMLAYSVPIFLRPLVMLDSWAFYLRMLVWPYHLATDYAYVPKKVIESGTLYWTWILPAGLGAAAWALRRRFQWLALGLVLAAAALLPVSGLIPFAYQEISTTADHYLYMPLLGLSIVVGGALASARAFQLSHGVTAAVLLALGIKSFLQVGYWKDNLTLFTHTVEITPGSAVAHNNLGKAYFEMNRVREAMDHYRASLKLNPKNDAAQVNLGGAMIQSGQTLEAITYYRDLIKSGVDVAEAHGNLGVALSEIGKLDEGIAELELATKKNPGYLDARLNLARYLSRLGRFAEAKKQLDTAAKYDPRNPNLANLVTEVQRGLAGSKP